MSQPCQLLALCHPPALKVLTSIRLLLDSLGNLALARHAHLLLGDGAAPVVEALGLVHGALQRVALSAKQVVGVGARTISLVLEAPNERFRLPALPQAVELVVGAVDVLAVSAFVKVSRVLCYGGQCMLTRGSAAW